MNTTLVAAIVIAVIVLSVVLYVQWRNSGAPLAPATSCPPCAKPAVNNAKAPVIDSVMPTNTSTGNDVTRPVFVTFDVAMDPSSLNTSTFYIQDSSGNRVVGSVGYNVDSYTAFFRAETVLIYDMTYTAVLVSGSNGVLTAEGGALAKNYVWSFTMAAQPINPYGPFNIWAASATPGGFLNSTDESELGVRFYSDVDGKITGIRFYRSPNDHGGNTGHLWDHNGNLLASVTFPGSPTSGWITAYFSSPIPITANTLYTASYHSVGYYSFNHNYFTGQGFDRGHLHVPADGTMGGANGVFHNGSSITFPVGSFSATNYWADVEFWATP